MKQISFTMIELIRRHGKPCRLADIIAESQIPRPTVSRALAELVEAGYLRKAGYGLYAVEDAAPRPLSVSPSKPRAVIMTGVFKRVFGDGLETSLRELLEPENITLKQRFRQDHEHSITDMLAAADLKKADALILFHADPLTKREEAILRDYPIPIVIIALPENAPVDTVNWNERLAYRKATEKLLEKACRKICFFGPTWDLTPSLINMEIGIDDAVRGHDVTLIKKRLNWFDLATEWKKNLCLDLLKSATRENPVGVVVNIPNLAPFMMFLSAFDLKFNQEVFVVGRRRYLETDDLTRVNHHACAIIVNPVDHIAALVAERIRRRLQGDTTPPFLSLAEAYIETPSHQTDSTTFGNTD